MLRQKMEGSAKLVPKPIAWVQCDDKKCLKWRKVPKEMISMLEKTPWFCHMNPDKEHASCCAEQEEMKVPKGETVVFSLLEEGSLVWAKVCGYPRWPSIICSDIVEDNFASFDDWGDVTHYHVEYFGDPRTHSWVLAKDVEIYGSGNGPVPFLLASHKGMKTIQSRKSFQRAVMQADKLTQLQPKERLKHCFFQPNKSNDVMNKEGGFLPGGSQEFKATQKNIAQKDERVNKSVPLSSNEENALESQYTNESTKKRRKRKGWELDSINLASKIDTNGNEEAKKRRKIAKNDCFQCCTALDSVSVNADITGNRLLDKESMANASKYVGLIPSKSCNSVPSGSASSLPSKRPQKAGKDIKQKGVCLLNINGVVVPVMLQNSKSNSNTSSQESICDNRSCGRYESAYGFSSFSSNQSKGELNNKEERIQDAGVESYVTQYIEEEASSVVKQTALQVGCSSKQGKNPSSKENTKQSNSLQLPKMTLYKPATSFKALFKQYADMQRLEESDRCIKYNGETLDLYSLYSIVQSSGGFDKASRDGSWKSICKTILGEDRPPTIAWLKEIYKRALLPFDEYLHSLNIIHPAKYVQGCDKVNTYCIEGDQPEENLAMKDQMQENTQEYSKYEISQLGSGKKDESNQKGGSLAKGELLAQEDEEEDVLYTLMGSKASSPKKEREVLVCDGHYSEGIDPDVHCGVIDDLMEISGTNDTTITKYDETLDVLETLERLQTAIADAELSLYHEDGLSSVERKTGGISSEQKLQSTNTTDGQGALFEALDALEESIAEYSSILELG